MKADRPFLGILMLDTRFERFEGDIGNARTWSMPVRFVTVPGAVPDRIVGISDYTFLEPFVAAGKQLCDEGAAAISTSCGFLSFYQRELAARLSVPVLSSAMVLLPLIDMTLPKGRRTGILTFSQEHLQPAHLAAAGIGYPVPVEGLAAGGRFQRAVLDDDKAADSFAAREAEVLHAARQLVAKHPDVGAILCECTNFGPHSAAITRELSLPVHDIVTALNWFWAGLRVKG